MREPVPAGMAVLNGAGELTGSMVIADWGCIETPVYLTSTHAVGRIYDGAVAAAVDADPRVGSEDFVIPVVGECDDSWLSEGRVVQVDAEDVGRAVAGRRIRRRRRGSRRSRDGDADEGLQGRHRNVESDRALDRRCRRRARPVELLPASALVMDGVPIGELLEEPPATRRTKAGSCIAVVAVDAPLSAHQLERVARRVRPRARALRLGRPPRERRDLRRLRPSRSPAAWRGACRDVPDADLNDVFEAVVDATEEAVLNALWAAPEVVGRDGRVAPRPPARRRARAPRPAHGRLG